MTKIVVLAALVLGLGLASVAVPGIGNSFIPAAQADCGGSNCWQETFRMTKIVVLAALVLGLGLASLAMPGIGNILTPAALADGSSGCSTC
jgi:hypothetical protein